MKESTPLLLKRYREALSKWKESGGLEGRGGSWNPQTRQHGFLPMPQPGHFGLVDEWALKVAAGIRKELGLEV